MSKWQDKEKVISERLGTFWIRRQFAESVSVCTMTRRFLFWNSSFTRGAPSMCKPSVTKSRHRTGATTTTPSATVAASVRRTSSPQLTRSARAPHRQLGTNAYVHERRERERLRRSGAAHHGSGGAAPETSELRQCLSGGAGPRRRQQLRLPVGRTTEDRSTTSRSRLESIGGHFKRTKFTTKVNIKLKEQH